MLTLSEKLKRINQVFDTNKVKDRGTTNEDVAKYYKTNILPYFWFHNNQGFVHMGLSKGNHYSSADVLEQPKFVAKYIESANATKVLELATGKGASCMYLANKYPKVTFYGVDLPESQIEVAKKEIKNYANFFVNEGDFHNLSLYETNFFDIVFVIEALCHSDSKDIVAREVNRVLKPNGLFIVVDGYLLKPQSELNKEELEAKELTEKGMAVNNFELYQDVKRKIMHAGFDVEYEENTTERIIPTLKRFGRLASLALFSFTPLGYLISNLFPKDFVYNSISGYLMPNLVEQGVVCYYITVFRKTL